MKDWATAKLEDVLNYIQPTNYIVSSTKYSDSYKIPVLTPGKSFIKGYTNETTGIFNQLPTIIFDDFTTAIQFVNFQFKVKSSAMKILVPTSSLVDIRYVFYLMKTLKVNTVTHKRHWISIFSQLPVKIASSSEQKIIADQIDEIFSDLDNAIENLKKVQEQLTVYRQSVLKCAFKNLYNKASIRTLTEIVTSGSRGWAEYYSETGAAFIRIGNLTRTSINLQMTDVQYVTLPDKTEGKRSLLQSGDILISITADLGSIGFISKDIGEAYINQHIALVRFKNKFQAKFMAWFLKSDVGQKSLLKNKRGAGKLGLGLDDIRDTTVPIVSDEVADNIVAKIDSQFSICEKFEQVINDGLLQSEGLRQSILKRAFEGKLTESWRGVNKNLISGKNSAEALLNEIKVKKVALQDKLKGKNKND